MPKKKEALTPIIANVPQLHYAFRLVDELQPYVRNSRTHSLEQIHELDCAIGAYGFTNPILVDGDDIIAGHGRVEAVQARYARGDAVRLPSGEVIPTGTIPTIDCSGWADDQRRAYIIFDNKSALNAGWDDDILAAELLALSQIDFDMGLTGFGEGELAELLSNEEPPEEGGASSSGQDVPARAVTRPGDTWLLGTHRLVCGDRTTATIDPEFCDEVVRRWQERTEESAILKADNRTFDQVARKRIRTRKAA